MNSQQTANYISFLPFSKEPTFMQTTETLCNFSLTNKLPWILVIQYILLSCFASHMWANKCNKKCQSSTKRTKRISNNRHILNKIWDGNGKCYRQYSIVAFRIARLNFSQEIHIQYCNNIHLILEWICVDCISVFAHIISVRCMNVHESRCTIHMNIK